MILDGSYASHDVTSRLLLNGFPRFKGTPIRWLYFLAVCIDDMLTSGQLFPVYEITSGSIEAHEKPG